MKTLLRNNPALRLNGIFILLLLFTGNVAFSQCSVNAPANVTKCIGQTYNLGTGVTVSNTTGAVTYSWDGAPFTASANKNVSPTVNTTYTLTIQDASGCTASTQVILTIIPIPTIYAGPDVHICAGSSTQLCITANSANGAIALYTWIGGGNTQCRTVSPTNQTTYTAYVQDAAGCAATDNITVFVNPLPVVDAGVDQTHCLSQGSIQLVGTPSGGTWSGTNITTGGLFTPSATGNFTQNYSYTNSNNCTGTDNVVINITTPSPIDGGVDREVCLNSSAIQLPNVGTWSGSSSVTSSGLFTPNSVGTHNLTVTSGSAGCTVNDNVIIVVLPLPTVNAGLDVNTCVGQCVNLNATASSTNGAINGISWAGSAMSSTSVLNPNVCPTVNTTYTLTITDAKNCYANDVVAVFVNPLPTVNAGPDINRCLMQGAFQLNGSPSGGTWSGSNVSPSGTFTPTANGNFTVTYTYTNSNNCTNSDQAVVNITTPSPINGGPDHEVCLGSTPVQLPNVGTWSGSSSITASGLFTPNAFGIHNLTVSAGATGCIVTDNVVINVLALPVVNAGVDVAICTSQCAQLNATATTNNGSITNISWSGTPISNSAILNPSACPTINTTYTLQITDSKGCQSTDAVNVAVNALPVVNAGNEITVCTNSAPVSLTGQTPAGGTWSGTGVTSSGVFTPGVAGDVTLTYTYTSGINCSNSSTRTIHVIDSTPINAGADEEVCLNATPIQLLSGGTWTGSTWVSSSGLFTPGMAGNYTLTYSTVIGQCTSTDQILVAVLPVPAVNAGVDQSVCTGDIVQLNGNATSTNGAITNYHWAQSYVSNQNISNPTFVSSSTATLTMTATDAKNCTASDAVTINVNPYSTIHAGNDISVCQNQTSIALNGATPTGGSWSGTGISSSGVFSITTAGIFNVTYSYTNSSGCISNDNLDITVVAPDILDAGPDLTLCLNTPAVQLSGTGSWSGSTWVSGTGLFTPGAVGNHTLTYSLTNGVCTSTDQIIAHVLSLPAVNAGPDQSACAGSIVQLNGAATSTNGAITNYYWQQSSVSNQNINNPTYTANTTATLTLEATDIEGCISSDNIVITANSFTIVNAGNDITLCNQPIGHQLTGFSPSGGSWSALNGGNVSASGLLTPSGVGDFTLEYCYTNSDNCQSCDQMVVQVQAPASVNVGSPIELCLGSPAIQLNATPAGGVWTGSSLVTSGGIFNPATVGLQNLTYTQGSGTCQISGALIVMVNSLPTANAGQDASICEGSTHLLSGSASGGDGDYDYSWNQPSLLSHPNSATPVLTTNTTTSLILTITDGNNCSASDNITITVVPMPVADFAVQSIACVHTPVSFANNSTNAINYSWSFGNATTSTAVNPTNEYALPGTFNVVLTAYNSLGCSTTDNASVEVITPPNSNFALSAVQGCSPLNVSFTNQSLGQYLNYNWNLATSSSTLANPPSVNYPAINTDQNYTISLTVQNMCGSHSSSQNIVVNPLPNASFETESSTACSPVVTSFFNNSTGNATSFTWEFGDGQTSTAAQPNDFIYTTGNQPEEYIIKLFAYNQCGSDMEEEVLTVMPNTIEIDLTPSVLVGCSPLFVQFNNTTIGATSHHFDFDDGVSSVLQSPSHIFENAGLYDIRYIANDGCSFDTLVKTIQVLQSPTIAISADQTTVCPLETVQFYSQTTGNVQQIIWDFGDSHSSNIPNPDHSFAIGNSYNIGATAIAQNGCEASASMLFTVHPKPIAAMNLNVTLGCSPLTICSDNQTTGATSYNWNFANGFTSSDLNACTEFINIGEGVTDYIVSLYAENDFGCFDYVNSTIQVQPQPVTTFNLAFNESCLSGENVGVSINTTGSNSYNWTVDGLAYSTELEPTFQFIGVGGHQVEVTSYNNYGCTDHHIEEFTIHPIPTIDILPNPFNGCAPLTVNFENETLHGYSYQWTFSNGHSSQDAEAEVIFKDPGLYDVQLTATSQFGCQSSQYFEDMIEVFVLPVASFTNTPDDDIIYETTVGYINQSEGATSYVWEFGDGAISSEYEPLHEYRRGGNYLVNLIATNEFGCASEYSKSIMIDNTFYVYVPSAFTPGTDGINDLFIPSFSSLDEIKTYTFEVTNRWGEVIFRTANPQEGWTGDVQGGDYFVHNDIFNWYVKIEFNNNQLARAYKGDVIVLR